MSIDELFIDLLKKRNSFYDKRFIKTLWFDIGTPHNYFKAFAYSYKQNKI
jgi:hypothetical protein